MLPLTEIYQKAADLLKYHGVFAPEYAHDSAIDCLAVDDLEGFMLWHRVLNVLETGTLLQTPTSPRIH